MPLAAASTIASHPSPSPLFSPPPKKTEHLQQPGTHAGRDHPAGPGAARGREPQAEGRGQAPEQQLVELVERQWQQRRAGAAPPVLQRGPDRGRGQRDLICIHEAFERKIGERGEKRELKEEEEEEEEERTPSQWFFFSSRLFRFLSFPSLTLFRPRPPPPKKKLSLLDPGHPSAGQAPRARRHQSPAYRARGVALRQGREARVRLSGSGPVSSGGARGAGE